MVKNFEQLNIGSVIKVRLANREVNKFQLKRNEFSFFNINFLILIIKVHRKDKRIFSIQQ
jgi:hypothetical protein